MIFLIQQTLVRDSYAARTLYYFFEHFNNLKFVEFMRSSYNFHKVSLSDTIQE